MNSFVDRKLKERELHLTEDDPNYPTYALHVYAQNVHACARNEKILNTILEKQYIITAEDKTTGKKIDIEKLKILKSYLKQGIYTINLFLRLEPEFF